MTDGNNYVVVHRGWGRGGYLDIAKNRSFGYRFVNSDYRHNYYQVEITDKKITRKLCKTTLNKPVLRWLKNNNEKLEVFLPPIGTLSLNHLERLQWIQDKHWIFDVDDFSGRIHNNLTALKRETRKYLQVEGKNLVEIDMPCSQWLFLALLCKKKGVPAADSFIQICENDLYSFIASKNNNWTRKEVKAKLTKECLFSKNGAKCQKSPIKKAFDQEFPSVAEFMKKQKSAKVTKLNKKPWNKLAQSLQEMERKFIVNTVCQRIMKEKPDIYVGTIHDSILTTPEHSQFILNIMNDEFSKIGANPKLTIKKFS